MKQQETNADSVQLQQKSDGIGTQVISADGRTRSEEEERINKWVVFAILAVGIFMATLDSSIVNISLPSIATYFGVPLSGAVEWVIIVYLVVIAGVLLS
jgi:hypothetical protein